MFSHPLRPARARDLTETDESVVLARQARARSALLRRRRMGALTITARLLLRLADALEAAQRGRQVSAAERSMLVGALDRVLTVHDQLRALLGVLAQDVPLPSPEAAQSARSLLTRLRPVAAAAATVPLLTYGPEQPSVPARDHEEPRR